MKDRAPLPALSAPAAGARNVDSMVGLMMEPVPTQA
jgi:hypothetical protein